MVPKVPVILAVKAVQQIETVDKQESDRNMKYLSIFLLYQTVSSKILIQ